MTASKETDNRQVAEAILVELLERSVSLCSGVLSAVLFGCCCCGARMEEGSLMALLFLWLRMRESNERGERLVI
jgi:hypothetical protein